jgi:hypothetical protein
MDFLVLVSKNYDIISARKNLISSRVTGAIIHDG